MLEITEIPVDGYERVCRAVDSASGFHAIIAVHSTVLGPDADKPKAPQGVGMTPQALLDIWNLPFASTNTGEGGCPAIPIPPSAVRTEATERIFGSRGRV